MLSISKISASSPPNNLAMTLFGLQKSSQLISQVRIPSRQEIVQTMLMGPNLYERLTWESELANAGIRHIRAAEMAEVNSVDLEANRYLGQHLLAEFKVKTLKLTPNEFEKIVFAGAIMAGATVICSRFFSNRAAGGISGIVVIQESHFTVHYLPQENYLAFDAFTCGTINFHVTVDYIKRKLHETPYDSIECKRGIQSKFNDEFIPGIAFHKAANLHFFQNENKNSAAGITSLGRHIVSEFYYCNPSKINDPKCVLDTFIDALSECNAEIKFSYVHQFQPQGISAVVVGDGLHLTIHDWPEFGYGSVDLCTFDPKINPEVVIKLLANQFQPQRISSYEFPRGNMEQGSRKLQAIFTELEPKEQNLLRNSTL